METPNVDQAPPVRRVAGIEVSEIERPAAGHIARLLAARARDAERGVRNDNAQQQNRNWQQERANVFQQSSVSLM